MLAAEVDQVTAEFGEVTEHRQKEAEATGPNVNQTSKLSFCPPFMPSFIPLSSRRLRSASLELLKANRPARRCLAIRARKPLTVLALESSADDSCCSIVTSSRQILANVVIKQHLLNAQYGGIHPLRAQEAHMAGVVSHSSSNGPAKGLGPERAARLKAQADNRSSLSL